MCAYKMRYSTKLRDQIIKGYRFLLFAKNMGKNLSRKHRQKLLKRTKELATDALKTASKRTLQKQQKQLVL